MSKFYSLMNRPATVPTPMGNFERPIFEERIVNGSKTLVEVGKENLKDFIEASKAETLITNIMKRFELGDTSVLQRVQGFYGDVTSMPGNLAEAQNILIKLNNQFDSFSPDIKRKFDNSFDKFVKEVSNSDVKSFVEIFGISPESTSVDMVETSGSEVE